MKIFPNEEMMISRRFEPHEICGYKNLAQVLRTKDFALQLKKLDDVGQLEGYASVFGVKDMQNEIVDPGAFSESLAKHKREGTYPLMLWQHDTDEPIGVWDDLADDGKGLFAKGHLLVNQNVPEADKAYSLLKAGAVRGMSIGYRVMPGGFVADEKAPGITHLTKLDLMEASIVSFPSNRRAMVEAVKSEQSWSKLQDMARKFRDGEPVPTKEYEEILRDAGFPKSIAVQIASVGYAKAIRSESGGEEATAAVKTALDEFRQALDGFTPPKL